MSFLGSAKAAGGDGIWRRELEFTFKFDSAEHLWCKTEGQTQNPKSCMLAFFSLLVVS